MKSLWGHAGPSQLLSVFHVPGTGISSVWVSHWQTHLGSFLLLTQLTTPHPAFAGWIFIAQAAVAPRGPGSDTHHPEVSAHVACAWFFSVWNKTAQNLINWFGFYYFAWVWLWGRCWSTNMLINDDKTVTNHSGSSLSKQQQEECWGCKN